MIEMTGIFIHKQAPVSLDQWASQLATVFVVPGLGLPFCLFPPTSETYSSNSISFSLIWRLWPKDEW
jgi:hypothetical protein